LKSVSFGLIMTFLGLFLFIQGLKYGLLPLGNSVGASLPALGNPFLITAVYFIVGFFSTLAEPAVASLAMEVEEISVGAMPNRALTYTIALGVGLGMAIGAFRIIHKIPYSYIIVPFALLCAVLGYFAPPRINGIAFDSGGVTTGSVTVPLNMAMAIGLSAAMGGTDPLIDGFGIIGLASFGPIVTVLLLGIIMKF